MKMLRSSIAMLVASTLLAVLNTQVAQAKTPNGSTVKPASVQSKEMMARKEMKRRHALGKKRKSSEGGSYFEHITALWQPVVEANKIQAKENAELAKKYKNAALAKEEKNPRAAARYEQLAFLYVDYAKQNLAIGKTLDLEKQKFRKKDLKKAQESIVEIEAKIGALNGGKRPARNWLTERELEKFYKHVNDNMRARVASDRRKTSR